MRHIASMLLLFTSLASASSNGIQTLHVASDVRLAFSPHGGSTQLVVSAIEGAQHEILVQAYGFTSTDIVKALGKAKDRGVDVRVILDKTNAKTRGGRRQYSGATYLKNHGIPVWIDDTVKIAHNKVMVMDGHGVLTGSFNFTKAAETSNAENVIYIENAPELAKAYADNWVARLQVSHPYSSWCRHGPTALPDTDSAH